MDVVKLNQRQQEILKRIIATGTLEVKELLEESKLPRSTLYNDLKLIRALSVEQSHGKIYFSTRHEFLHTHLDSRFWLYRDAKERIAAYVAKNLIQDGDSIFLDCGSSASILADEIIQNNISGLSVFTNNPHALRGLYYYQGINKLILIGGHVDPNDASIYGEYTSRFLRDVVDINYRKLFLGVDGISIDGNIYIDNIYKAEQKQIMMKKAKEMYILLDESKVEKTTGRAIAQIDKQITEKGQKSICCIIGLLSHEAPENHTKEFVRSFQDNVILVS